jgi:hypothetical protein
MSNRNAGHASPGPSKSPPIPTDKGPLTPGSRVITIDPCPVCGKNDFGGKAERGRHMFGKHQIAGTSPTALQRRKKKVNDGQGQAYSTSNQTPSVAQESPAGPLSGDAIPDFILGHLLGQLDAIISRTAEQEGIPKTKLTHRICSLLQVTPRR